MVILFSLLCTDPSSEIQTLLLGLSKDKKRYLHLLEFTEFGERDRMLHHTNASDFKLVIRHSCDLAHFWSLEPCKILPGHLSVYSSVSSHMACLFSHLHSISFLYSLTLKCLIIIFLCIEV